MLLNIQLCPIMSHLVAFSIFNPNLITGLAGAKALADHVERMHENTQQIKCSKCELVFENIVELNNHIMECCKEDKVYNCTKCESVWNNAHVLKLHMELDHNIEKPVICEICGQTLSAQKHLAR